MSDFETSNDSSGNLAANQPTVPDFTVDGGSAAVPDPEDTQQDPVVVRRPQQNQNVTNDPIRNQYSQQNTNADTMEDPLGNRAQPVSNHQKVWPDPLAPDDTMEDPFAAGGKVWADPLAQDDTVADAHGSGRKVFPDPLAPDDTVADAHGSGRKVYPDPLAADATQQEFGSARGRQAGASGESTNWDPVNGSSPAPPITSPPQAKKKSGHGFSEGDLFARKYEIKGHIGQGGMGVVYKALDLVLGRTVAIKFLKGKSGISQIEMSRFQQEAKAIASLNHSNIIRVHDMSVTDEGDPFFVLEYIEGHALSNEIRGKKQLPLERALNIISQVCDALQHAHEHGVIHRDIKPSNLMIVPQPNGTEVVKLLDFGIAKLSPIDEQTLLKLTKTGELFGSPHYMSPEQCSGETIHATTDIYSLGCVLYELICGVPPFSGTNAIETLDKHKNASLTSVSSRRSDLPESKLVDALLDKMMAKEPSDRYQTPSEVKFAIQEIERRLEGSPFQRIVKRTFPNGLEDAQGKKNAVVVMACIISVGGIAFAAFTIANVSVKSAPNTVLPTKSLKSWEVYDLRGQQLFDQGALQAAEKQFLLAVEKAKSEKGDRRNLHMYTSLQELRMVYHVLNDKKGLDWANGELIECEIPSLEKPSQHSWNEILKKASLASTSAEFDFVINMSAELILNGNSNSNKVGKKEVLRALAKTIESKNDSNRALHQIEILEAYITWLENGAPMSKRASNAFAQLCKLSPEELSPAFSSILITLGLLERDPTVIEKFAEYRSQNCSSAIHKSVAQAGLSEIYRLTGRKDSAAEAIESRLLSEEKQVPRNYGFVSSALKLRADQYCNDGKYNSAIPLLVRAVAVSVCIPSLRSSESVALSDRLRSALSDAYIGALRFDEAESLLKTLLQTRQPNAFFRAELLRQLGSVYLLKRQLKKAEAALTEAVMLYEANPSTDQDINNQYRSTLSTLTSIRKSRSAN